MSRLNVISTWNLIRHLNIGAGRVLWQDVVGIDQAIKKKTFHKNNALPLDSDGGVHSHIRHLFGLVETAKEVGVPHVYIHFFGDGCDTAPRSAAGYAKDLIEFIEKEKLGEIVTVVGRYYAMDRDKRWERVKTAVDALTQGKGKIEKIDLSVDLIAKIEERYKDETDEFLKPIVVGKNGRIKGNHRFSQSSKVTPHFDITEHDTSSTIAPIPINVSILEDIEISTMSKYKAKFTFPVAFPSQAMTNVLALVNDQVPKLKKGAKQGVKQSHVAETEKYTHVTFFNGGVKNYDNEDREMVASPKVGHTGVYEAAVKAITATDAAVGTIYKVCQEAGYVLITTDHGNAEQMINVKTGNLHTAHAMNPVPFIIAGPKGEGALCGLSPTVLEVMGLPKPEGMSFGISYASHWDTGRFISEMKRRSLLVPKPK
ncbi:hypothetical protein M422DRAFT_46927 [Sphaerobolus stellatus SS14]|uniref:phosphoglycerate mutase (2,3-diphosphoglycerate-independent) n=1 Tax=Sphaerobolus stellatus (strain SS14) TaxID=990650 RepID=A0A0C9VRS0_SPHS4|nr:hypothetical protein M422DRAFT_46927 [Sphaerobolus stellatus SS14]